MNETILPLNSADKSDNRNDKQYRRAATITILALIVSLLESAILWTSIFDDPILRGGLLSGIFVQLLILAAIFWSWEKQTPFRPTLTLISAAFSVLVVLAPLVVLVVVGLQFAIVMSDFR